MKKFELLKFYLVTINHVRVKESPSVFELETVLIHLNDIVGYTLHEFVYEVGPKYKQLHCHAIVSVPEKFRYGKKYSTFKFNKKMFRLHWKLLKFELLDLTRKYLRKTNAVVIDQHTLDLLVND